MQAGGKAHARAGRSAPAQTGSSFLSRPASLPGDTLNLRKSLAKTEAERDVYRSEAEKANREADRLNEVMALIPRDTGALLARLGLSSH